MTMMLMTIMTENKRQEEKKTKMKKNKKKKKERPVIILYTGYIKATNDMETVISIDNRIRKTANVYGEHLSC